jgi:tetratricopeptide (TPR) repeat protein
MQSKETKAEEKEKFTKLIESYTEVLALEPHNSLAYEKRGDAHLKLGNYVEAIKDYYHVLIPGEYFSIYKKLGDAFYQQANYDSVFESYDMAIINYKRALGLLNQKSMEMHYALEDTLAQAYVGRACAYFKMGNYKQAIIDCTEALRLDRSMPLPYKVMGNAHFEMGNYEQAIKDHTTYLKQWSWTNHEDEDKGEDLEKILGEIKSPNIVKVNPQVLFEAIKSLPDKKQIPLLKSCFDKDTGLGKFFSELPKKTFFKNSLKEDTLKKISNCLEKLTIDEDFVVVAPGEQIANILHNARPDKNHRPQPEPENKYTAVNHHNKL